jgi:hypothetical protein
LALHFSSYFTTNVRYSCPDFFRELLVLDPEGVNILMMGHNDWNSTKK